MEKGIIRKFYTRFDTSRLGLIAMRVYIKFQYVTPEKKIEIINHFIDCKYSTVLGTIEGNYDLLVVFIFQEFNDIYHFWIESLKKYGNYFSKRVISIFADETDYPKSFLIDGKDNRVELKTTLGISKKVNLDSLDKKLLELLGKDSRISSVDIAKKLNTTTDVINYRIKKFRKNGIILGFKLLINLSVLDYKWFKSDIFLKDYNDIIRIIKYLENNPNLICVDRTIGYADIELEFFLKSTDDLLKIFEDVSTKFKDTIKDYTYFRLVKMYKFFGVDDALKLCKETG